MRPRQQRVIVQRAIARRSRRDSRSRRRTRRCRINRSNRLNRVDRQKNLQSRRNRRCTLRGVASRVRKTSPAKVRVGDIAREAGVSTATVSRVINNFSYVSPENRERVLEVIRRHNYYPSAHARSLASGRSRLIGLVISDIANPFFPEVVKGIETAAYEQGYEVILADTNYDPRRMANYVRRFIERGVQGVALMTSEFSQPLLDELSNREVSVVFLDIGRPGPHSSNLAVDYSTGIEQAVAHLVELGHKRIAYVGGPAHLRSSKRRQTAFVRSVRRHIGREPSGLFEGDFRIAGGRQAGEALLASRGRYTAVMVANDMMALGVAQACRAAGRVIPRDLSIVGFDDIALAALAQPPLTTVEIPREVLGRKAIEALLATVSDPERRGVEIDIPTSLVIRQSTGPAPAAAKTRRVKRTSRAARA
jgi:LacI family transcriptional regulator